MSEKEIELKKDAPPHVGNQQVSVDKIIDCIKQKALRQTSVAQSAIANSIYLASIITDTEGLIQGFNQGAERMLGYEAKNVINQLSMMLVLDAEEISTRAQALTIEFATPTPMMPDFSTLVYKAMQGNEDIYELTYMHKDGSRVPAMVSVMALHDIDHLQDIIGYLFIGTDNSARKLIELERRSLLNIQQDMNEQLHRTNIILRRGEEKLAVILNSIGDAVMATDDQAQVTFLNPIAEHLTGWTHEEAIGRPVSDIFHIINKENRQLATIPVLKTLADGTKHGLANHTILIARDGSEHDIADSCAPIRDRDDEVVGAVLAFRDVTKEYAGQQSLSDNTKMIQTILNTMVDGVISFDAKSYIIETANPAAERMFDYGHAELIGKNFDELIPELNRDQHHHFLDDYRASAEASAAGLSREVVGVSKNGSRFAMEIVVSEMSLNGQCYFMGILRDITLRKQAEEEQEKLDQRLRDQQFYTRSLIESNIDALMTTNPSGIITDVNKQMEALTQCTRDELIGAPFKHFFTSPERADQGIKLVLKEKKLLNYELTALARDGKETEVSCNVCTFYDRDRKLQGVFAAARDITERKSFERALYDKNIELEDAIAVTKNANLAKSNFLSSMSHELRTPLNAILGFAQLLNSNAPQLEPLQKRRIDQILKAGWYLLDLINEVLDLALIESGKLSLAIEPMSLTEVMQECQEMIEPLAQKYGIRVIFPSFDTPYLVKADRTRVKQTIINLLSNAIKYNRKEGTVVVTCSRGHAGRIRIGVNDSGEGLSSEQLAQLFQPFNRLGQEAKVDEGTGIGLVVCKQLVELMGGDIGVESIVGHGSLFWIELNLADEQPTIVDHTNTDTTSASSQGIEPLFTLLYVEDNPDNLMLVEEIINRRSDIRLLSAQDGERGIEIAQTVKPDVILMDINLPNINGLDAMKVLSADPETTHIPVLALSASAMPSDIEKGLEAGFFRYLTKPIMINEFMATLDAALKFATTQSPHNHDRSEKT